MKRRLLLSLLSLALVVGLAQAWWSFAPSAFGGRNSYVVTSGTSMQPRFHSGDLAILRMGDYYKVGDVVGYRSKTLRTIVMHRIVADERGRYAFKGDNNSWLDPERLSRDEIIGKLWLKVPQGGLVLETIKRHQRPLGVTIAAIMLLGTAGGTARGVRRRRSRQAIRPARAASDAAFVGAAIVLAIAVSAGAWAFLTPTEESVSDTASYEQTGAFGYRAATAPGPAYGGHRIRTGDTVFLRLARELEVWFQYRLRADGRHESFGSIALAAELRDDSGWERTLPLTVRAFRGDSAEIRHRLQPTLLNRIVQRARIQTGVTGGSVELALVARVRAAGTLHGAPLASEFTSRLRFGLDALSLRPLAAESDALARKSGTVPVIDERATRLALGPLTVEGARVRAGSASLALLALLALGIVSYSRLGAPPAREIDRIRARHRSLLVPVAGRLTPLTQPLVEVATWEALRRIAEVVQSPILDDCSSSPTLTVLTQEAAYVLRPCLAPEQTRQASLEPSRRGSGTVGYPVEETDLSVANPSTRANSRIRKASTALASRASSLTTTGSPTGNRRWRFSTSQCPRIGGIEVARRSHLAVAFPETGVEDGRRLGDCGR